MIGQLRKKLIWLFTAATGLILTLVLGVTGFYQFTQSRSKADQRFQSYLMDLSDKLELDTNFSDEWLTRLEHTGGLIIHVEDNGFPLLFSGAWNPATNRDTLIAMAKETALKEQVDTAKRPFSYSTQKAVFSLHGKHGDTYNAAVLVLSIDKGFRSMVLLADTTGQTRTLIFQAIFFLVLEAFGILALLLVSRYVVGRALKPVEEYHRKQNEFVSAASHELRSPLAVIQASASAITSMPEQGPKMAAAISEECTRAGKLVKNLLFLASADSGSMTSHLKAVEADDLLLKLFESYEPLCKEKGIRLNLRMPEDILPQVSANPVWLYQMLSIFLDNAISYGCSENPEIQLEAKYLDSEVLLSVCDHGPGISEGSKSLIFDRFYREDASRSKKEHFGLGLSIAKTLADQMGVKITVADKHWGGATFYLHLRIIDICQ